MLYNDYHAILPVLVCFKRNAFFQVSSKEQSHETKTSSKQRKKMNELDDLFDTLDFVSDALAPPRVMYEDKATVDERKTKKNGGTARSTEASRRREEYTRSKLQGSSTGESTASTKRTLRSQTSKDKQLAKETSIANDQKGTLKDQPATRRDRKTGTRGQQSEIDDVPLGDTTRSRQRRNRAAEQNSTEPLRRSRRIADSSNRKAVLVLDSSGYPEESSTDLNQAFVDSTFNESKRETDTANSGVDHSKSSGRKKKVRRQSSTVKSNKSRARTKRTGYKSRRDRSIDT